VDSDLHRCLLRPPAQLHRNSLADDESLANELFLFTNAKAFPTTRNFASKHNCLAWYSGFECSVGDARSDSSHILAGLLSEWSIGQYAMSHKYIVIHPIVPVSSGSSVDAVSRFIFLRIRTRHQPDIPPAFPVESHLSCKTLPDNVLVAFVPSSTICKLTSMPNSLIHRCRRIWLATAFLGVVIIAATADAQDATVSDPLSTTTNSGSESLRFSFEGMPWRDVIRWFAETSDLALHISDVPTGSFTYSDPNSFTPDEALDRLNLFLLPQGFTLVRSGKLLSVINLSDPRSLQQLDSLAKFVTIEQLQQASDNDVVKCIFALGELDAEDAVDELSALKLMLAPAIFSKTNQLMITDTARKLKNVKTILDAFQPGELANGTVIKSFILEHVDAEDILVVARPHLGLATGEMIGIDVSLSADLQGKNIFVTGIEDKVKLVEGLITAIDKPEKGLSTADGDAELRSHVVKNGNVETVYNVLVTLLAGETVRLSKDETAGTIVALATPEIQKEIEQTVQQLQASDAEFVVIPLKSIDPYVVVSLLEEMFDLTESKRRESAGIEAFTRHGNSRGFDLLKGVENSNAPRIDADPANRRLFVRGTKHQVEQIKAIVAELDSGTSRTLGSNEQIRILPLRGREGERLLKTAVKFWRSNPVFLYPSLDDGRNEISERIAAEDSAKSNPFSSEDARQSSPVSENAQLLTGDLRSQEAAIRCQFTPRGLILQSEDTKALDQFEDHLVTIAGPVDSTPSPPVVFYLKYTRPDDAIWMLAELLDGSEASLSGESGSLVNGFVAGSSANFSGSLVSSREGTTTMIAGAITVVADSRLNRLIVQGTSNDIDQIEGYLKIIDKDTSITSIETYGTSHVIELVYSRASEVADAIRSAYEGRVTGNVPGIGQPQPGSQQPGQAGQPTAPQPQEKPTNDKKSAGKELVAKPAKTLEPKMTIAIHEPSNSLIVTAPDQLFREVEQLAKIIDSRSQKSVRLVKVPESVAIESLQEIFSGGVRKGSGTRQPTPKQR
jgi:type II secretory pathway component GspD/PulD (secretin)